jgi:ATP-binding cassette subfamily B protein
MSQFKIFVNDLIKVSKLTKTKNKKIRIFITGIISNLIVLLDILIILSFTNVFSDDISIDNFITIFLFDNIYLLPLLVILRFSCIYYEKINITKLRLEVEENLRDQLIEEIFSQGNYSSSDAYFYINTIAGQVSSFYSTLATFIGSVLQVFAYTAYLLITDFNSLVILSGGVAILYFPTIYIVKQGRKTSHKTYLTSQEISEKIEKIVDNLYLIKILNLAHEELKNFRKSLKEYYNSTLVNIKLGSISAIIPNFLTFFGLSVAIVFLDVVKFITLDFIGVALRLFQALGVLNSNLHLVSAYHVYLEKLFLLEKNKEIVQTSNFVIDKNIDDSIAIQINNLDFKYFNSEVNIFENLNFSISKNKHTVITGSNGSGKSTLLGLFSGIFYATKGKVVSYSNNFGFVGAIPMILNASLRENLLYGNLNQKDDNQLNEYIEKFQVFNNENEGSLDANVSNKSLSTGQMQKISFIRALLKDIDILLLDESLSNVDKKSKETILNVLDNLDITIINITHNIDDYENIDKHIKIEVENEKRTVSYRS